MTLEELIRDGLDVDEVPPGTAVILRMRNPLDAQQVTDIRDQASAVAERLDIKVAVVSHDFDVYVVPQDHHTVNGTPPEPEIRR